MNRLFGGLKMSWLKVILFAAIAGVYTGIVMTIPFLKGTSFQDIGVMYEWWVVFAVIIVVNCGKSREAMLKCFVFFLISQPLVYLTEILIGTLDLDQAWRYYSNIWFPMTLLTLPGGFIAYFCKKQNVLGAIILGLGNTILTALSMFYFGRAIMSFPSHLLSGLFCIAAIVVMSLCVQKKAVNRVIAMIVPVVLAVAILVLAKLTGRVIIY